MIRAVYPSDVPAVWPSVSGHIERAIRKGRAVISGEQVYAALLDGRMQLYVSEHGAMVTEIEIGARKVIRIVALGSDNLPAWIGDIHGMLTAWRDAIGADAVQFTGRRGWARHFGRSLGWDEVGVIMEATK